MEGAQLAMADEIRHTRSCLEMAARYGAGNVEPGPLELGVVGGRVSLEDAVRSAVREGCVGETMAALLASRAAEAATDPHARATLAVIAEDETRHAALAWRFVAWAIEQGGDTARTAVLDALALARADVQHGLAAEAIPNHELDAEVSPHGRLPARARAAIAREALDRVVLPCIQALFASSRPIS
ncbi:MAG: ferritin-like domain-containing protein [Myxococcales bacterium]|nr:ferritin-like domain-containing protein [Myxococcales bacterium]